MTVKKQLVVKYQCPSSVMFVDLTLGDQGMRGEYVVRSSSYSTIRMLERFLHPFGA